MKTVEVIKVLDAPIQPVFAVLADHARYDRFPGIVGSELTRQGVNDRNGVGAQRRIQLRGITLWEDIIGYENNALLEYRIVRLKPNVAHHELGQIRFESLPDNRTHVHWTSTFRARVPMIGRLVEAPIAKQFTNAFGQVLQTVEQLALVSAS